MPEKPHITPQQWKLKVLKLIEELTLEQKKDLVEKVRWKARLPRAFIEGWFSGARAPHCGYFEKSLRWIRESKEELGLG